MSKSNCLMLDQKLFNCAVSKKNTQIDLISSFLLIVQVSHSYARTIFHKLTIKFFFKNWIISVRQLVIAAFCLNYMHSRLVNILDCSTTFARTKIIFISELLYFPPFDLLGNYFVEI